MRNIIATILIGLLFNTSFAQKGQSTETSSNFDFSDFKKYSYLILQYPKSNPGDKHNKLRNASSTGFFIKAKNRLFLITNYHVFTGVEGWNPAYRYKFKETYDSVRVRYYNKSGKPQYYTINCLSINEDRQLVSFFEYPDVFVFEIKDLPKTAVIHSIEKFLARKWLSSDEIVAFSHQYSLSPGNSLTSQANLLAPKIIEEETYSRLLGFNDVAPNLNTIVDLTGGNPVVIGEVFNSQISLDGSKLSIGGEWLGLGGGISKMSEYQTPSLLDCRFLETRDVLLSSENFNLIEGHHIVVGLDPTSLNDNNSLFAGIEAIKVFEDPIPSNLTVDARLLEAGDVLFSSENFNLDEGHPIIVGLDDPLSLNAHNSLFASIEAIKVSEDPIPSNLTVDLRLFKTGNILLSNENFSLGEVQTVQIGLDGQELLNFNNSLFPGNGVIKASEDQTPYSLVLDSRLLMAGENIPFFQLNPTKEDPLVLNNNIQLITYEKAIPFIFENEAAEDEETVLMKRLDYEAFLATLYIGQPIEPSFYNDKKFDSLNLLLTPFAYQASSGSPVFFKCSRFVGNKKVEWIEFAGIQSGTNQVRNYAIIVKAEQILYKINEALNKDKKKGTRSKTL